jgi:hypothetical protein
VDHRSATEHEGTLEEEIQNLGFDPRHLTREEQSELVELHRLLPDEASTV